MSATPADLIGKAAAAQRERLIALRREIHRHPELGLTTPRTQEIIVRELERTDGVEGIATGDDCTWVTAEIRGGAAGAGTRRVALRADMDALPLTETGDDEWVSELDGRMHACGHDGHVAMLLGAASVLAGSRDHFSGTVRLLFQPGEEGFGGAPVMIDAGAVDDVDAAFAIHLQPMARPHRVLYRNGAMLAAFDDFTVTFLGAGGHASSPHTTRDPIPAIGPLVDTLSHVVARETDPDDRVVFSVTKVVAGTKENVIPHSAECLGTVRSLSKQGRELALERLRRVADGIALARGLDVRVEIRPGYPPTINRAGAVADVVVAARSLGLTEREMASTFMGAEDFSYMLDRVPGAMVFLGCGVPGGGPLHSDRMRIDEDVLPTGAALHAAVALQMLSDASAA